MKICILVSTFLFCFSTSLTSELPAAPLVYDESINGDLSNFFDQTPKFLDVGTNIVSGSVTRRRLAGSGPQSDADKLAFRVPNGTRITSITYDITKSAGNLNPLGIDLGLDKFDEDGVNRTTLYRPPTLISTLIPSTGAEPFVSILPIYHGKYIINQLSISSSGAGAYYTADYQYQIEVDVVPEPNSLSLFVITALGMFAKRKWM